MSFVATAVGITAVTGLYGAYSSYTSGQAGADAIEAEAKARRQQEAEQARIDSVKESEEMLKLRDQQRRRRASMEGMYAASGVLLTDSAADILTKQREIDELNIQNLHYSGNEQRKLNKWAAENNLAQSKFSAGVTRSNAGRSLVSGILNTGSTVASSGTYKKGSGWVWN